MKNQYVGDIGDYGKYGLLRFLASNDIKIGVNWYLTKYEDTSDGKFTKYLTEDKNKAYREYDRNLFDQLEPIVKKGKDKSIADIEKAGIIPNAVFYRKKLRLSDITNARLRKKIRDDWHSNALEMLADKSIDLIFADPDNGTLSGSIGNVKKTLSKNSEKYTMLYELADYYKQGKNVVYYCHKARRKQDKWNEKKSELKTVCPDASIIVLTFHCGTQRSFIFGIHPEYIAKYNKLTDEFLKTNWGSVPSKSGKIPFDKEDIKE